MSKRKRNHTALFHFAELDAADVAGYPSMIQDIYARNIDGIILRRVCTAATIRRVLERLQRGEPPVHRTDYNWGFVFGRVLVSPYDDLPRYFTDAANFRAACQVLFAPDDTFETRIETLLSALCGGLPVGVPPGLDQTTYTPATIRVLNAGNELKLHCGNQFSYRLPKMRHLVSIADLQDQLSYFMLLNQPEAGGELILYDLEWGDTDDGMLAGNRNIHDVIEEYDSMVVPLHAGDMVLFDGGRIWHRVSEVQGMQPRITIGGFVCYAQDHQQIYYWS
jgi:hypothetical protein